jgi:mitochondrial fission protein ELM1
MEIYEKIYENATYNFYQKQFRKEKLEEMFTRKIREYCRKKEMERTIIEDNKIIFLKRVWTKMKEEKIRLHLHGRNISLSYRNWNKMIINNGLNLDKELMKIVLNRFIRKSYLDDIDQYRCNKYYFDLVKELKFDHRINDMKEM